LKNKWHVPIAREQVLKILTILLPVTNVEDRAEFLKGSSLEGAIIICTLKLVPVVKEKERSLAESAIFVTLKR